MKFEFWFIALGIEFQPDFGLVPLPRPRAGFFVVVHLEFYFLAGLDLSTIAFAVEAGVTAGDERTERGDDVMDGYVKVFTGEA